MHWQGSADGDADFDLVPQMDTDVTLRAGGRIVVVECKYTEAVYQRNYFAGKFRAEHLYQLATYLRNIASE